MVELATGAFVTYSMPLIGEEPGVDEVIALGAEVLRAIAQTINSVCPRHRTQG